MKQYHMTDADGKKLIIEKDNGIRIEILEEPSAEYIASMPPVIPETEPRNYLAEIDDLNARVDKMEQAFHGAAS